MDEANAEFFRSSRCRLFGVGEDEKARGIAVFAGIAEHVAGMFADFLPVLPVGCW